MNKLPARTGLEWLKQGFALFRVQPGILTMFLFTNLLVSLLIGSVPFVGSLFAIVLIPSFSIAVMQACNLIAQGQRVRPDVLLTGFRAPAFARLCKLGLVYLAVFLVLKLLMMVTVDEDALMRQMTTPVDPKSPPTIALSDALSMLMIFALQAVVLVGLCFSVPLAYWKQMTAFKATFYSVFGVLGAARPIGLMLLAWFGMFLFGCLVVSLVFSSNMNLARVVILWASLLLMLVLQCAIFASYRQLFADPAPGTEPPMPKSAE